MQDMTMVTAPPASAGTIKEMVIKDGFVGPVRLLDACECRSAIWHLRRRRRPPPIHWAKGGAVADRFLLDVATMPTILGPVRAILGDDVILWGASDVRRDPGQVHVWHTDIETSDPSGRFVSVWIGLENTGVESGLQLISGSHRFGKTIQQVVHEHGLKRGSASPNDVVKWSKELDPDAELRQPEVEDGMGIIFDGRVWHGSVNTRSSGVRTALLLQYAGGDIPVREADLSQLEWPFRFYDDRRPPVVRVSGTPRPDINRVFDPPSARGRFRGVPPKVVPVCLPLAEDRDKVKRSYPLFDGPTPVMNRLGCHVSVLSPGQTPHAPHSHGEEELLIVLEGEANLVITDSPALEAVRSERLLPGSFVYYPAWQHHTLHNLSERPVTYLMLRWYAAGFQSAPPLGVRVFRPEADSVPDAGRSVMTPLFECSTDYLGRLHSHMTTMAPGAGYEPHADEYDVAIILLEGMVETLGETVGPCAAIFYPAGEPHGMRNVGDGPARYVVFEFHKSRPGTARTGLWRGLRRLFGSRSH
jgi:mannose-6-phosphate isomerase-like protein (cupin superfamily)